MSAAPPPVIVHQYPIFAAPVYAAPPVYAYARPLGVADGAIQVTFAAVGKISDL
jgi:hypothetical protein